MTYVILETDTRKRLDDLCRLGARPRIIAAMMPTVPEAVIRAHWRHYQKRSPSKGPATSRPSSYWATMKVRLHSSYALNAYLDLEEKLFHFIDAYVVAYEEYARNIEEPESFDWFWGLVRNYLDGHIGRVQCGVCSAVYVHNVDDLVNDRNCPCHRLLLTQEQEAAVQPKVDSQAEADMNVSAGVLVAAKPVDGDSAKHRKMAH